MKEILELIYNSEEGITEQEVYKAFPSISNHEVHKALTSYIKTNQIRVSEDEGVTRYTAVVNKTVDYENLIVSLIQQSGTQGMWLKDIKDKSNVPHNLVLKILKSLEQSRKVKTVKSVKNSRKMYIMYDLCPDEDVSGGVWFVNNDVDVVFVNRMLEIIYKFIFKPEDDCTLYKVDSLVRLSDVEDFINRSNICEIELGINEIARLIDCLVYDGRVEKIKVEDGIALRVLKSDFYEH